MPWLESNMFRKITGLAVHDQLAKSERKSNRVINFNARDGHPPHQSALPRASSQRQSRLRELPRGSFLTLGSPAPLRIQSG